MRLSTIASILAGIFITAFGALTGCVLREECACTMDYRPPLSVHVRDASGPVTGAQVKVFRSKDGKDLTNTAFAAGMSGQPGWYEVMDDNSGSAFPEGVLDMDIRVTAAKGGMRAEKVIRVSTDACRCHLDYRVAGPDTLVLAP